MLNILTLIVLLLGPVGMLSFFNHAVAGEELISEKLQKPLGYLAFFLGFFLSIRFGMVFL